MKPKPQEKSVWEPNNKQKALITRLARQSATSIDFVRKLVLKLGLEYAEDYLRPQIELVASLSEKDEPEPEPALEERPPVPEAVPEPFHPALDADRLEPQENGSTRNGSLDVSERRAEPGEGEQNDFINSVTDRSDSGKPVEIDDATQ